ncbi:hypothetical protein [Methanocalculus sp. MSAO_Arc2]
MCSQIRRTEAAADHHLPVAVVFAVPGAVRKEAPVIFRNMPWRSRSLS